MINLLKFLILIIIGIFVFNFFSTNTGQIEADWFGYKIETTPVFFVLLVVVALIIISFVYNLLASIIGFPRLFKSKLKQAKLESELNNVVKGFSALLSG